MSDHIHDFEGGLGFCMETQSQKWAETTLSTPDGVVLEVVNNSIKLNSSS